METQRKGPLVDFTISNIRKEHNSTFLTIFLATHCIFELNSNQFCKNALINYSFINIFCIRVRNSRYQFLAKVYYFFASVIFVD